MSLRVWRLRRAAARKSLRTPQAARLHLPRRLRVEGLELRLALCGPDCLEVELLPEFDQFGPQIETVMGYKAAGESDDEARVAFAIYDTGASVVTYSAGDQLLFELLGSPLPIKVPGGAEADAIGGPLVGDVSQPGEIIADGLHAVTLSGDFLDVGIDLNGAVRTEGVQAFVGTTGGSPILPTITGTVVHNPSPTHPQGNAALIDMTAYELDFGALFPEIPEFQGIVVSLPDLRFVEPGTKLTASHDGSVTPPVRIPLELWGENNHGDPGDSITTSPNPVQTGVTVRHGAASLGDNTLLFDTGAQLSVISTEMALGLGLDLDHPSTSITVQGAAGQVTVPGFTIDALELPRDDNGDGAIDGVLRFSQVPIYVLDVVEGLDGLLGMNLFNVAQGLLYDPHDPAGPSLQLSFFTNLVRELPDPEELELIEELGQANPLFAALSGSLVGQNLPSFSPAPLTPPNAAPAADDDAGQTLEDAAVTIDVLANDHDADGHPLAISQTSAPAHGALQVNADQTIVYQPDDDFFGEDSFTYTVSDGQGGEATATVNVTVAPVNDAPKFTLTGNQTVMEDAGPQTVDAFLTGASAGPANVAAQSLTLAITHDNPALFSAPRAIDLATGRLTYAPADEAHGAATVTVTLSDDGGTENGGSDRLSRTFTITVGAGNDAPTLLTLAGDTVPENAPGAEIGAVAATDPDPGDTHTWTVSDDRFEIVNGVLKLKAGVALDYETAATVTLEITATDSGSPPASRTQEFTLAVQDVLEQDHPWQNPAELRWDVDNNGAVELYDVLLIVQALRERQGAYALPLGIAAEDGPPPYLDVDGDDWVTSFDLLETVQEYREIFLSGLSGGEAESAVDRVFASAPFTPAEASLATPASPNDAPVALPSLEEMLDDLAANLERQGASRR